MTPPKPVKAWALSWRSIDEKARLRVYASKYYALREMVEGDTIVPVLITPIPPKRKAKGKRK